MVVELSGGGSRKYLFAFLHVVGGRSEGDGLGDDSGEVRRCSNTLVIISQYYVTCMFVLPFFTHHFIIVCMKCS